MSKASETFLVDQKYLRAQWKPSLKENEVFLPSPKLGWPLGRLHTHQQEWSLFCVWHAWLIARQSSMEKNKCCELAWFDKQIQNLLKGIWLCPLVRTSCLDRAHGISGCELKRLPLVQSFFIKSDNIPNLHTEAYRLKRTDQSWHLWENWITGYVILSCPAGQPKPCLSVMHSLASSGKEECFSSV